jgi:hypothetical protein
MDANTLKFDHYFAKFPILYVTIGRSKINQILIAGLSYEILQKFVRILEALCHLTFLCALWCFSVIPRAIFPGLLTIEGETRHKLLEIL